jgi:hypothetical protein
MAAGSLADALVGKYLNASVNTLNTNVTNLGSSTRLGSIAGIDRGTIAVNTGSSNFDTVTVTAVVMARSILHNLGAATTNVVGWPIWRMTLTNTTTITVTAEVMTVAGGEDALGALVVTASYQLVEYNA